MIWQMCLYTTPRARRMKEKTDKLDFVKLKFFFDMQSTLLRK